MVVLSATACGSACADRQKPRALPVPDGQLHLGDDRQFVRQQRVVVPAQAAGRRRLDRQDAVRGQPGVDGDEHFVHGPARHQRGALVHATRRRLAPSRPFILIRDPHGRASSLQNSR